MENVNRSLILSGVVLVVCLSAVHAAEAKNERVTERRFATEAVPALKLANARMRPDGKLEFRAEWNGQGKVMIESSTDLKEWTNEALGTSSGTFSFTNPGTMGINKFYRARDILQRLGGALRDIQTEEPLANAEVTLSFNDSWLHKDLVAQTDSGGGYSFVAPGDQAIRQIVVEKAGYEPLTISHPLNSSAGAHAVLNLWLAPQGYRPANDDFQNRLPLEGTNVTVAARTFAATSEPGHSLVISFDDYVTAYPRNLWWSWTAPLDGAVFIARNSPGDSGVVVYTGDSLQELARVWDTSDADDAFFVKKGVEYQIAFGTSQPQEGGYSLNMVAPEGPNGSRAELGGPFPALPGEDEGGAATLWIDDPLLLYSASNGTSPLKFQWLKDGMEIPGATDSTFAIIEVESADAGAYAVRVSNEAGVVVTKSIEITVLPERPHLPEIMKGNWLQETSTGLVILTFTDTEFSAKLAVDGSFAGRGSYRLIKDRWSYGYRLTMNFDEPQTEVHEYLIQSNGVEDDSYHGTITDAEGNKIEVQGTLRRLPLP